MWHDINFTARGGSWAAPQIISGDIQPYAPPQIVNSRDGLIILYSGQNPGPGSLSVDIFAVIKDSGNWQAPLNVSNDGFNNFNPTGTADASGNIHIVWQGQNSAWPYNKRIMYSVLNAAGQIIAGPEEIENSSAGFAPNILIDPQGKIHAVWYHCPHDFECDGIKYSLNSGSGWSDPLKLIDTNAIWSFDREPEIILNSEGKFLIAWSYRSSEIDFIELDGTATSTKTIFNLGSATDSVNLAANSSGRPYLVWKKSGGGTNGIYFTYKKENGEWRTVETIYESADSVYSPRAVIDQRNIMHLVWYGGDFNIYYSNAFIE